MASYTLDDIRAAAERDYGSTDIDINGQTVSLLNPLRLPKEKRDHLEAIQESMGSEDSDDEALLKDALRTVAKEGWQAELLLGAVGDDLAMLASVFKAYTEGQQTGEASASQD